MYRPLNHTILVACPLLSYRNDWGIVHHGEAHPDPGDHPRLPLEIRAGGRQTIAAHGLHRALRDKHPRAPLCLLSERNSKNGRVPAPHRHCPVPLRLAG